MDGRLPSGLGDGVDARGAPGGCGAGPGRYAAPLPGDLRVCSLPVCGCDLILMCGSAYLPKEPHSSGTTDRLHHT